MAVSWKYLGLRMLGRAAAFVGRSPRGGLHVVFLVRAGLRREVDYVRTPRVLRARGGDAGRRVHHGGHSLLRFLRLSRGAVDRLRGRAGGHNDASVRRRPKAMTSGSRAWKIRAHAYARILSSSCRSHKGPCCPGITKSPRWVRCSPRLSGMGTPTYMCATKRRRGLLARAKRHPSLRKLRVKNPSRRVLRGGGGTGRTYLQPRGRHVGTAEGSIVVHGRPLAQRS